HLVPFPSNPPPRFGRRLLIRPGAGKVTNSAKKTTGPQRTPADGSERYEYAFAPGIVRRLCPGGGWGRRTFGFCRGCRGRAASSLELLRVGQEPCLFADLRPVRRVHVGAHRRQIHRTG